MVTRAGGAVPVVVDYGPTSPSTSGIKKLELFIDSEGTAHATEDSSQFVVCSL
jgi:hypothetical protein